jgi:hypothetical protein
MKHKSPFIRVNLRFHICYQNPRVFLSCSPDQLLYYLAPQGRASPLKPPIRQQFRTPHASKGIFRIPNALVSA